MNFSEIYVEDCIKTIASTTHTATSNNVIWIDYELEDLINVEISADVKTTVISGFRIFMTNRNSLGPTPNVWGNHIGVYCGNAEKFGLVYCNTSEQTLNSDFTPSTNTFYNLKITYEDGVFKGYYDGNLIGTININLPSNSKKIGFASWALAKTITVENLKIKPL